MTQVKRIKIIALISNYATSGTSLRGVHCVSTNFTRFFDLDKLPRLNGNTLYLFTSETVGLKCAT